MYESYFGLSQRPFAAAPLVERFFPASSIDAARQALSRCIERAEGVGVCIAAPGMGKTLLLEVLADQFSEPFGAVLLSAGAWASRRELLQAICFELKIPYQGLDEGELRLALVNQLTRTEKHRRGIVLLVDEAHTLSVPLLEELRMLSNLVHAGEPRVRLAIAGNLRLEELLAAPQLESFSQRLSCRTYLEPFDRAETTDYVRFQIAVAGGRVEQVFEPAAVDAVYRATDGVPRLVNQLCDHALLMAYSQEQRPVIARWIEKAWADLQQLPVPWQDPPAAHADTSSASSVVEFGALSDDLDDFNPEASHEFASEAASHESEYESPWEATAESEPQAKDYTAHASRDIARTEHAHDEVPPSVLPADQLAGAAEEATEGTDDARGMVDEHDDAVRRAEARFEELASQFEALQAEEAPAQTSEFTEAELSFDDEDPFDEFDEEERLIDPYAAASEAAWPFIDSAREPTETPVEPVRSDKVDSNHPEAYEPQWEQPTAEQQAEEVVAEEPEYEEPTADEDEEPCEAVEEWNVHDSYREAGTAAMPEIMSITSLPREAPPERPELLAEACQEMPEDADAECASSECDESADCANETLAEVVIDPYEGLTELGERLRQEALRLTDVQHSTVEPEQETEPAEMSESVAYLDLPALYEEQAEATDGSVEPVTAEIEASEAPQADIVAPGTADQPVETPEVEEPIELHQGKLTLAEAIRRRKEASAPAGVHAQPAEIEEPRLEQQPTVAEAAAPHEPSPESEQAEEAIFDDESNPSGEQVVIVLDETAQTEQTEPDDAPRVHREDYHTLFERLRRG